MLKKPEDGVQMGRNLFATVQASQGFAFISDSIEVDHTPEEVRDVAKAALAQTEVTANLLRQWINANC